MAGEETHAIGSDGVRRAKIWLDRTTRADARWTTPDRVAVKKLTFEWANQKRDPFSFDLGGVLIGGDNDGEEFFAESKRYKDAQDQGAHYRSYLAKCYCAYIARPERCDHFMWITWAPFLVNKWSSLTDTDFVKAAVLDRRVDALDCTDAEEAEKKLDHEAIAAVAKRLWIIVLSDRQESHLMMSKEHLGVIRQHQTEKSA